MNNNSYLDYYNGRLVAVRHWEQLESFWETIRNSDDAWYAYQVGDIPPDKTLTTRELDLLLQELHQLLVRDHDEEYCGIVYADDHQSPSFVKIYDPNNLGSACGSSGTHTFPGWTLSKIPPVDLEAAFPPPGNRRRWWQKLFS